LDRSLSEFHRSFLKLDRSFSEFYRSFLDLDRSFLEIYRSFFKSNWSFFGPNVGFLKTHPDFRSKQPVLPILRVSDLLGKKRQRQAGCGPIPAIDLPYRPPANPLDSPAPFRYTTPMPAVIPRLPFHDPGHATGGRLRS
jgi:hypothetical protein